MYSVRETTKGHGSTNLIVLLYVLLITTTLIGRYGTNYWVIFCASTLIHLIIEAGLVNSGVRKSAVYVGNYKLPWLLEVLLRALVEGPAFCVPAYFVADSLQRGDVLMSIVGAIIVVGLASFYMGWADRRDLNKVHSKSEILLTRRAMTQVKPVLLLALVNAIGIIALFMIPAPFRIHAFTYIGAYAVLVLLFYFINYNFGVRYVEILDQKKKTYKKPSLWQQIVGLTFTSVYEMTLLISPAYWITFYLGLFS